MIAFSNADLTAWAERKRVSSHPTNGRADLDKCTCGGVNCLAAQAVADHFHALAEADR